MDLKELIKQARVPRTQRQFAQDLGVSRLTVILWEKGTHEPNDSQLEKMGISKQFTRDPAGEAVS